MKRTPLFEEHIKAGGRIIPFAGYEMPGQYKAGAKAEHINVRGKAGLFDVSHMGRLEVKGPDTIEFLNRLVTADVSKLKEGQSKYCLLLNEQGTVEDDIIINFINSTETLICANGINKDKVLGIFKDNLGTFQVEINDLTDETGQIALQGPISFDILEGNTDFDLKNLKFYTFTHCKVFDIDMLVAKTGYTGEDGVEFYLKNDDLVTLWQKLMEKGTDMGLLPIGLIARDTLRLEMRYPLYGLEISQTINPIEAGLQKFIDMDKEDFLGKKSLEEIYKNGIKNKIYGFTLDEKGIARHDYKAFVNSQVAGQVQSGSFIPGSSISAGTVLLNDTSLKENDKIEIEIRNVKKQATIKMGNFKK